jgi:hypothetical protein
MGEKDKEDVGEESDKMDDQDESTKIITRIRKYVGRRSG